jgi:hypothetical protein
MDWDLDAAVRFVATTARVLERRRLDVLLGDTGGSTGVVTALDAYRNEDGGYGWGLEPDHRSSTSQPVAAMHALEVLAEIRDVTTPRPVEICDWLAGHSLADGGMPFILPFTDTVGSAGHWVSGDPSVSSVQMTTQLAAQAHRLARVRPDVAAHPWLGRATDYCLAELEQARDLHPYELMFALRFLDAAAGADERAERLVRRLSTSVSAGEPIPMPGGAEGEALHLLDLTPYRDAPSRAYVTAAALANDVERLAGRQQDDGGWTVDFPAYGPAAALEWRGYATVQSVGILRGLDL